MIHKQKALIVNLDGYIYLQCECRIQRGYEVTDRYIEHLKENFKYINPNGKHKICDYDLGGGKGRDPSTWTSWSVSEMAEMLKKQNIAFEFGVDERMPFKF